ncbi:MAG: iron-containing alcohol dehydrogenase, partial [Duodenibacillus sp.]|nr:iron-containing alcohol dehydrogenase [Duodenibacillus sp.]
MQNFTYCNPTKLIFGRDAHKAIGSEIASFAGGGKVLIVYGGGSAVRTGTLAAVAQSCRDAGLTVLEKGGVEPNPKVELVREVIEIARREAVDVLLAVGGGSVIDTAKAAAMGYFYDGDVWDFFCGRAQPKKALPVCCVLTIPAAGSEQSIRTVITNGNVKNGAGNACVRPKVSAVNPELFFTLPENQIAAGVIDMMSHIMERYFTNTPDVALTDRLAEGLLCAIIEAAPVALADNTDYESHATLMWAGMLAHNNSVGVGREQDWASHQIGHEISAMYDTAHG